MKKSFSQISVRKVFWHRKQERFLDKFYRKVDLSGSGDREEALSSSLGQQRLAPFQVGDYLEVVVTSKPPGKRQRPIEDDYRRPPREVNDWRQQREQPRDNDDRDRKRIREEEQQRDEWPQGGDEKDKGGW